MNGRAPIYCEDYVDDTKISTKLIFTYVDKTSYGDFVTYCDCKYKVSRIIDRHPTIKRIIRTKRD